jgi:hypothetical protein
MLLCMHAEANVHQEGLKQALSEVHAIRASEEALMAERVAAATREFAQGLSDIQMQFQKQARSLELKTQEAIAQRKQAC